MTRPLLPLGTLAVAMAVAQPALAQSTIRHPGDHPNYAFEAEPHLALDPFGDEGIGPGFRGTVVLVDNGFVSSINNSVGIGFGLDWLFYGDHCGGNPRHCDNRTIAMIPIVMQWNFWLHRNWSVFGEPGMKFNIRTGHGDDFALDVFTIYGGGRFHFNDDVALTLRIGAPFFNDNVISLGASFFL